jgi:DNA polymerase-1
VKALIDGDPLAYRASFGTVEVTDWGDGVITKLVDPEAAEDALDALVEQVLRDVDATSFEIAISDQEDNFRWRVHPSYKRNRNPEDRPELLPHMRERLLKVYKAKLKPSLEADDVLGIMATHPRWATDGDRVICSIDKDLKQIPGLYYNMRSGFPEAITEVDGDLFFLTQVLMGDRVDGYTGIPGVGPAKAAKILQAALDARAHLSGDAIRCCWQAVVKAYEDAGLSEEDALAQARMARILRAKDYDFKEGKPKLWTPPQR